jgi:hypothetical protein
MAKSRLNPVDFDLAKGCVNSAYCLYPEHKSSAPIIYIAPRCAKLPNFVAVFCRRHFRKGKHCRRQNEITFLERRFLMLRYKAVNCISAKLRPFATSLYLFGEILTDLRQLIAEIARAAVP